MYQTGDIVCTCDVEGGTYYAQLRGFLQDDYCEKAAVITWLIPTRKNLNHFDPLLFVPGILKFLIYGFVFGRDLV